MVGSGIGLKLRMIVYITETRDFLNFNSQKAPFLRRRVFGNHGLSNESSIEIGTG
jgi:hypothetical protein